MRDFFFYTRWHAVLRSSAQNFLALGGRGKEYAGTHAQAGTPARSGAGVASSHETHAKTPAIYGRFCERLTPMRGVNVAALSHVWTWGPLHVFRPALFCLGVSPAHAHGTARAQGFLLCPGPIAIGRHPPFRLFGGRGSLSRSAVGKKSCMNGGMRS